MECTWLANVKLLKPIKFLITEAGRKAPRGGAFRPAGSPRGAPRVNIAANSLKLDRPDGKRYAMKRTSGIVAASAALLCTSVAVFAQGSAPATPAAATPRMHTWWRDPGAGTRPFTADAKKLPLISVKGNRFVDPDGKPMLFRGLAISDPDKLEMQGHWNKNHFVQVKEMGTTLLRIPVHPVAWRERTPIEYIKLLDQAVQWARSEEHTSELQSLR